MSNKPLNIGEEVAVQMPMKTVVSLITVVAIGVWAYFGVIERLNKKLKFIDFRSLNDTHIYKKQ